MFLFKEMIRQLFYYFTIITFRLSTLSKTMKKLCLNFFVFKKSLCELVCRSTAKADGVKSRGSAFGTISKPLFKFGDCRNRNRSFAMAYPYLYLKKIE